jgi:CubicO group peptidase (beta-lactamase class C family)
MPDSDSIGTAMRAAVADGVFPGAVLLVRVRGEIRCHTAVGDAALLPERQSASIGTHYDLASLTKPLATATAVLLLLQDRAVALEHPIDRHLPELRTSPVAGATPYQLLNHSAGLPGWRPFYERIAEENRRRAGFLGSDEAKGMVLGLIGRELLVYPRGARSLYSDLGFILLGLMVERVGGLPLDEFCQRRIYVPLGAAPLGFRRLKPADHTSENTVGIAATELHPWRGRVLRGEVHDENAYVLGGVAGHAGLFGTAEAVSAVTGEWAAAWNGRGRLLDGVLAREFTTRQAQTPGSSWGLGWDTPSPPSSSGSRLSPRAFGHLGYTGTSIWIDPDVQLEVILLSNRVHPSRENTAIQQFRPMIHDVIYKELVEKNSAR